MKRREFCRQITAVGGTVLMGSLINACSSKEEPLPTAAALAPTPTATDRPTNTPWPPTDVPPTASPYPTRTPTQEPTASPDPTATRQPTATAEPGGAAVALVRTSDRARGVQRALALLAANSFRGERVLLKPNFNSLDEAPGSTHPDILEALTVELLNKGARTITIGERSGMGDTRDVLKERGVLDLADRLGLETLILDELEEDDWVVRDFGDSHWSDGFAVPRRLLDSGCVVQTCNLKTHRYGGHFTMSLKNSVGLVAKTVESGGHNYMSELHSSDYQRQMIAEVNTVYRPALIVMDGVEAFVDGGPATGTKVKPNLVIAGTDPVAVDAVGVAILRRYGTTPEVSEGRIFEQEQIARAVELGLGVDAPHKIRFLTDDRVSQIYAEAIRETLLL
jgi:uncharacterized protein (DUF362 family)